MTDDEAYPVNIPAMQQDQGLERHPDVTFRVDENVSGKSALLEAIALGPGFGAEGGTKNVQNKTGETVSSLHDQLGLVKGFKAPKDHYFQRAESFYNVATYMDETGYLDGYGRKSLHQRSHGEWFVTLLTTKFRGKGLYPFDDPKAALPPSQQLAAPSAIHQLVADDSQFIVATHSPPCSRARGRSSCFWMARELTGSPTKTPKHRAVTRDFLNNCPRRLGMLFFPMKTTRNLARHGPAGKLRSPVFSSLGSSVIGERER